MNIQKGKIMGFRGSWLSGLAQLIIHNERGERDLVPCENAPTVRALEAAFEDFIKPGHSVDEKAIVGKEIYYSRDEMGLMLAAFTPVEEASEELIEAYENQEPLK